MKEHHRFRLFFAWDFQREEDWINRLSRDKGLQLERVGCCHYVFAEGEKGAYTYRLELLRRTACDAAEKRYLQAVHAQEVCRNGEWGYYRLPAGSTFAQYACCDSKLAYLRGIYRRYLIFGTAVYIALAMDMSAFLSMRMTVLHGVALVLLTLLALAFSVGLTRFHVVSVSYTHLEVLCMIPVPSQAVAGLGDQKGFSHIESRRQEVVDLLLLFRGQHIGFVLLICL